MKVVHGLGIASLATGIMIFFSGDPIEAENTIKNHQLNSSDTVLFDNLDLKNNEALTLCIELAKENTFGMRVSGMTAREFAEKKCANEINQTKSSKVNLKK